MLNSDTGEVLAEESEGDRIKYTKAKSIVSFARVKENAISNRMKWKEEEGYRGWFPNTFYKGNIVEISKTLGELDVYEKAFLFSVSPYVGYDDNCLRHANGRVLNLNNLIGITGISKSKLLKVTQSLSEKSLVYKEKVGKSTKYYINPYLYSRGNRVKKKIKKFFENYEIKSQNCTLWKNLDI